jgi:hypothetical protein
MPTFNAEDIDVDVNEFLSACDGGEINEIIESLIEDGYINKSQRITPGQMCASEQIFEEHLDVLHGKWNLLTKEEEETIIKITKRFK